MSSTSLNGSAPPEFVSLQDAAARLSVSTDHLRDCIARGALPAYRIGNGRGRVRVRLTDLAVLMKRIPTIGGAEMKR